MMAPLGCLLGLFHLTILIYTTQAIPNNYKKPRQTFDSEPNPEPKVVHKRNLRGKVSFAYFTNWGVYGTNFQPTDIVPQHITHLLYAFGNTDQLNGTIRLSDPWIDEQIKFTGDPEYEPGNNLYGCLKQIYLLKLKHRSLKVLLSIGGWTYSQNGNFDFIVDREARNNFVGSAIQVVEDYGFDGIDIDYEYPANEAQGQGFADLVSELRAAFRRLERRKRDRIPYLITVAAAAGTGGYRYLRIKQMDGELDFWNLMASTYDFSGSWSSFADDHANLYGGARTGISGDATVRQYINQGASADKITLGIPMYGRGFRNTTGLGAPFNGIGGENGSGFYSYKILPLSGARVYENMTDISSYSYDRHTKELVSYDTPNIVRQKAKYITRNGLAGAMFWELSCDKKGPRSLVATGARTLGPLDRSQNHISYPNSKWDNLRDNFHLTPSPASQY